MLAAAGEGRQLSADNFTADVRLTDEQRLDWLRLIRSDNVGPRTFRALLNHCGGARAALDALPELARRGGAASPARICSREAAEREIAASHRLGIALIALGEPDYPARLRMIDDAPPLIGVRGKSAVLASNMIALVGSRNASAAGVKFAERIARELGDAGFIIVSGLARGIDAAAHRASLATGTVAVLAGGHDHIYPAEHVPLLESILADRRGVTEMPLGWEPRGRDFPRRNRLISGLSARRRHRRGGAPLGLADHRAHGARTRAARCFAVPGSPLDPRAEGTNGLLKQGATLVTEAADVLTVIRPILGQTHRTAGTGTGRHRRPAPPSPASTSARASSACLGPRRYHRRPGPAVAFLARDRAHGAAGTRARRPPGASRRRAGVAGIRRCR